MGFRVVGGRFVAVLLAVGFMAAAAGCKSSDSSDALDPGTGEGASAPEGKVLQSELRAYCPSVSLREGTSYFNTYEKNSQDDPTKLIYQSSLTAITRKCTYGSGMITMDIAVAGKVVPGPVATDGTVKMPIRVAVMRGDEVLYSNLTPYEVRVSKASGATQFVFHDANVTFPTPEPGSVEVFAGYDEGPQKKKPADEL
jgi:hypothetical protein